MYVPGPEYQVGINCDQLWQIGQTINNRLVDNFIPGNECCIRFHFGRFVLPPKQKQGFVKLHFRIWNSGWHPFFWDNGKR